VEFYFAPSSFAWISDFAQRAVVRNKRDGKPSLARSTRACMLTPRVRVQGHGRPQNSIFSLICQAVTAKRNSRSLFRAARLALAALTNQADSFVSLFTANPWKSKKKRKGDGITTKNKKNRWAREKSWHDCTL